MNSLGSADFILNCFNPAYPKHYSTLNYPKPNLTHGENLDYINIDETLNDYVKQNKNETISKIHENKIEEVQNETKNKDNEKTIEQFDNSQLKSDCYNFVIKFDIKTIVIIIMIFVIMILYYKYDFYKHKYLKYSFLVKHEQKYDYDY